VALGDAMIATLILIALQTAILLALCWRADRFGRN
jgi:hypothetical protein